eukprot:CAMPEP_0174234226 /NCGR_PEP_ID=MMETSP0417-20130205/4040_1 /TAXON_ID=242541 /ORGANISM="Mayorella sp, Strain BSH-02190019" /LENGTH=460 /DNA_ID=CAMNT_0015312561 /DNA_START=178 /DNA_END=1557 /DNA_ORIENTATION=-
MSAEQHRSTPSRRLAVMSSHLASPAAELSSSTSVCSAPSGLKALTSAGSAKNDDDVVICASVRTAIGKAKRGTLKDTSPENLLRPVLAEALSRSGLDPALLGDVIVGTVLPRGGQGATEARIACLLAGIPVHVPVTTVNRQCSSGLQAIANAAAAIRAGFYEVALAAGVESMSNNSMSAWDGVVNEEALAHEFAKDCYTPMGVTSENVASRFSISREVQDQFSYDSHQKAAAAQEAGRFVAEIVPIQVKVQDAEGNESSVLFSQDEGIRASTPLEKYGQLRTVFSSDGSTTAGNASQVSDGAAAAVVASRRAAVRLGLPILARLCSFSAVGVEPSIMGVGPAAAIPLAVRDAGLTLSQVDLFEINEAFASQAVYCIQKLAIDPALVNVNGGAIALGHPLGCTGARMTATLLYEMKRRKARFGVVSMCIGSGMGAAAVFEANGDQAQEVGTTNLITGRKSV